MKTHEETCKHCGGSLSVRNPTGDCDHLYYPENCRVCLEARYLLPSEPEKTVTRIFEEARAKIPKEEFDKLPTDGADQHDHYLYGSPKKTEPDDIEKRMAEIAQMLPAWCYEDELLNYQQKATRSDAISWLLSQLQASRAEAGKYREALERIEGFTNYSTTTAQIMQGIAEAALSQILKP